MSDLSELLYKMERSCPTLVRLKGGTLQSHDDLVYELTEFISRLIGETGSDQADRRVHKAAGDGYNEGFDAGQSTCRVEEAKAEGFEEGYQLALRKAKDQYVELGAPVFAQIALELDAVMEERFPGPKLVQ